MFKVAESVLSDATGFDDIGGGAGRGIGIAKGLGGGGGGKRKRVGFQVIDAQDFPESLVTYVWVGNGPRSTNTCMCLLHRVQRKGAAINIFDKGSHGTAGGKGGGSAGSRKTSLTFTTKSVAARLKSNVAANRARRNEMPTHGFCCVGIAVGDVDWMVRRISPQATLRQSVPPLCPFGLGTRPCSLSNSPTLLSFAYRQGREKLRGRARG